MQATVLQAVSATLGRPVGLEEPLMTAGLDSLGAAPSLLHHLHSGHAVLTPVLCILLPHADSPRDSSGCAL